MEKDPFFTNSISLNWQQSDPNSDDPLPPCFLNLNWDQSADQPTNFESALSSLVSSPSAAAATAPADSVVIRELIGRLGSICNSGDISPNSHYQSTTTSCYSTPLNSPPKLNLRGGIPISANPMPFAADPGFAERAARFSCFGGRNYGGQFGLQEPGKLSRVSSSQSLKAAAGTPMDVQLEKFGALVSGSSTPEEGEFGNGQEESSAVSDKMAASGGEISNARKRKAASRGKGKEAANPLKAAMEDNDSNAKRCRSAAEAEGREKDAAVKPKAEQNGEKENNAKPPEPPKQDYIHVRARRGQATDSHSLAERVRREKISERMKFLQDLVPGCNKVTGKAVMLDEIINYVQSLQRQVEFLSMKLATVNPRLDFNMDSLLSKDLHQSRGPAVPHSVYPLEATSTGFSYGNSSQGPPLQPIMANGLEPPSSVNHLDPALRRALSMQLPSLDGFGDAAGQLGAFWEDDLQSVVQMGFGQNQEAVFSSQTFQGSLPTNHMKIEL